MIPYGRQYINDADIEAVVDVLKSDWLTQGPTVPAFEAEISKYTGAASGVAVNSATSALHIACLALGVGPGDLVWTSPNTFVASANCALYCGAKVDFVDIDPNTYNMCADGLSKKLAKAKVAGRLPKVVIPVHFGGQPCEMDKIRELSKTYGFRVIEDASHAIGASYMGKKTGACDFSDITVISFHPVKIITSGEGGMALSNDSDLIESMRRGRSHGVVNDPVLMRPRPIEEIWNYQQIELGFNYRMSDIHAALGLSQLSQLDTFVSGRRKIAVSYDAAFAGLPVQIPQQNPNAFSSFHLYPLRVNEQVCGKSQRHVYQYLRQSGVAANLHYIPVHRQPYYENLGFCSGDFPESEAFHREAISLPMYPTLTIADQEYVIEQVQKALAL